MKTPPFQDDSKIAKGFVHEKLTFDSSSDIVTVLFRILSKFYAPKPTRPFQMTPHSVKNGSNLLFNQSKTQKTCKVELKNLSKVIKTN